MSAPLLSLRSVSKTYVVARDLLGAAKHRARAVDGVDIEVAEGESVALVGESGAGKSTVGRIAARLIRPDAGAVRFDGSDPFTLARRDLRRWRAQVQIVFQDPYSSFDPRLTVRTSVAEPLLAQGVSRTERLRRADALLDRVGLTGDIARRRPSQLSGGQLQRASIARALSTTPRLIVCDEPLSALDNSVSAQVANLLLDVQRDTGVALVFISHDLPLVRYLAVRTYVMYQGRVVEQGSTGHILDNAEHPYTRALVDAVPEPHPARQAERRVQRRRTLPADAGHVATGCSYSARCPFAKPVCSEEVPTLVAVADARESACHFAGLLPPTTQLLLEDS